MVRRASDSPGAGAAPWLTPSNGRVLTGEERFFAEAVQVEVHRAGRFVLFAEGVQPHASVGVEVDPDETAELRDTRDAKLVQPESVIQRAIVGAVVAMTAVWGAMRPMAASDPFCV